VIHLTVQEKKMNARTEPQAKTEEKLHCRWFFFGIIPSLFIGSALVPMEIGANQYLALYGILFFASCGYVTVGMKKKIRRHVTIGTILMWSAPVIPIILLVIAYDILGPLTR
jgi:hypothetical protein